MAPRFLRTNKKVTGTSSARLATVCDLALGDNYAQGSALQEASLLLAGSGSITAATNSIMEQAKRDGRGLKVGGALSKLLRILPLLREPLLNFSVAFQCVGHLLFALSPQAEAQEVGQGIAPSVSK